MSLISRFLTLTLLFAGLVTCLPTCRSVNHFCTVTQHGVCCNDAHNPTATSSTTLPDPTRALPAIDLRSAHWSPGGKKVYCHKITEQTPNFCMECDSGKVYDQDSCHMKSASQNIPEGATSYPVVYKQFEETIEPAFKFTAVMAAINNRWVTQGELSTVNRDIEKFNVEQKDASRPIEIKKATAYVGGLTEFLAPLVSSALSLAFGIFDIFVEESWKEYLLAQNEKLWTNANLFQDSHFGKESPSGYTHAMKFVNDGSIYMEFVENTSSAPEHYRLTVPRYAHGYFSWSCSPMNMDSTVGTSHGLGVDLILPVGGNYYCSIVPVYRWDDRFPIDKCCECGVDLVNKCLDEAKGDPSITSITYVGRTQHVYMADSFQRLSLMMQEYDYSTLVTALEKSTDLLLSK